MYDNQTHQGINMLSYFAVLDFGDSHHFESFTVTTMTWLTVMNICVTNDQGHVPFVVVTI